MTKQATFQPGKQFVFFLFFFGLGSPQSELGFLQDRQKDRHYWEAWYYLNISALVLLWTSPSTSNNTSRRGWCSYYKIAMRQLIIHRMCIIINCQSHRLPSNLSSLTSAYGRGVDKRVDKLYREYNVGVQASSTLSMSSWHVLMGYIAKGRIVAGDAKPTPHSAWG